ncbi:transcription initiation factor TFIID subunit 5-like [Tubulanus polymorphus]|uniref:transcription initiation factor TFIID subunit 5-like n=1 Tax=Tubulanus polymorphus TaxID=672921 RepID=UPI003DA5E6D6
MADDKPIAESTDAVKEDSTTDKQTLLAVLQFLKKNNLKETEEILRKECKLSDDDLSKDKEDQKDDVSQALAAYKSEGDPSLYADLYSSLKSYVDSSLDANRCELSLVLYPVFVHMYLELVYNDHESQAQEFFERFSKDQEEYYQEDIHKLSTVTKKQHMQGHELMDNFKTSKFVIRMSRESYSHLKRHLQESQQNKLFTFILEKIYIDVFDGNPRSKQQIDAVSGSMTGESLREANKVRVYYGLLKEPDINIPIEEDEEPPEEGSEKPKKKKPKKDPSVMKKAKNDPNAPPLTRIPIPDLKDADKLDKVNQFRESLKRVKLGPDCLPSVCFYTFLNAYQGVTSVDVSEDSSLLSAGFADSSIRVFTLTPNSLRKMKTSDELELIDKEADDVLERMMDNRTAEECKSLLGHTGPVYSTSFSRDKNYLLSSSEDGTVRLWSLLTWTNLVAYKGHNFPVWNAHFSPHGHYFASCGHDRIARLWITDHHQPVRIFAGHLSDVECIRFHPNCNYLATGSVDRTVRLWDVLSGQCVRVLTGHKGPVQCLCFSPDGRYLASAGVDKMVLLWDIANGNQIAQLKGHADVIYTLCFSREGSVLASGGIDCKVILWDVNKIFEEQDSEGIVNVPSTSMNEVQNYKIVTWPTKSSPVLHLHFTRRNLLLAGGPFVAPS